MWGRGLSRASESVFNGYDVSFWEGKTVLETDGGDGCKT